MAEEEPTLEEAESSPEEPEPTLAEETLAAEEPAAEEETPLSAGEVRLLRVLFRRAAREPWVSTRASTFGNHPGPSHLERVSVDIAPLLWPRDFERAGVVLERSPRGPGPDFTAEWRAFVTLCKWIAKALLGVVSTTTLVLLLEYFVRRVAQRWRLWRYRHGT